MDCLHCVYFYFAEHKNSLRTLVQINDAQTDRLVGLCSSIKRTANTTSTYVHSQNKLLYVKANNIQKTHQVRLIETDVHEAIEGKQTPYHTYIKKYMCTPPSLYRGLELEYWVV